MRISKHTDETVPTSCPINIIIGKDHIANYYYFPFLGKEREWELEAQTYMH